MSPHCFRPGMLGAQLLILEIRRSWFEIFCETCFTQHSSRNALVGDKLLSCSASSPLLKSQTTGLSVPTLSMRMYFPICIYLPFGQHLVSIQHSQTLRSVLLAQHSCSPAVAHTGRSPCSRLVRTLWGLGHAGRAMLTLSSQSLPESSSLNR